MTSRLSDIQPGHAARVSGVHTGGNIRRRLQDIGVVEGTLIECVMKSPLGDPTAYLIKDAVIALRHEEADSIAVERL